MADYFHDEWMLASIIAEYILTLPSEKERVIQILDCCIFGCGSFFVVKLKL